MQPHSCGVDALRSDRLHDCAIGPFDETPAHEASTSTPITQYPRIARPQLARFTPAPLAFCPTHYRQSGGGFQALRRATSRVCRIGQHRHRTSRPIRAKTIPDGQQHQVGIRDPRRHGRKLPETVAASMWENRNGNPLPSAMTKSNSRAKSASRVCFALVKTFASTSAVRADHFQSTSD